ncbi:MAG: hypothetical protein D6798_09415 [Deltaproteobacteria bacterium]|nr:MAG: hypothetical protein D6798_09415 [Deltaproteobacteria bacterium]
MLALTAPVRAATAEDAAPQVPAEAATTEAAPEDAAPRADTLDTPDPASPTVPGYGVGPRDVLAIEVFQEDSLSGEFVVAEDGTIDFPLLGRVEVDGLSPSEIDALLTRRLGAEFLVDPQVQVQVRAFASKPVRVLGAVKKPGIYQLSGPTSVLEIVAMAGGMSTTGVTELRITRRGRADPIVVRLDGAEAGDGTWNLEEGDTILVMPPKVVYVAGEVDKPGAVPFSEGMTVSQAVILAGGSNQQANLRKVFIKRGDDQIRVNLKRILQGREEDVVLQPDDQVLISESVL